MGAGRVKGLTIEIGGDTTGLDKALSGTNKEIKNTQSQLKDVERLLKLDPSNTELLAQKQKLLSQSVGEVKGKLSQLKDAEKQVQEQMKHGKVSQEQYDALKREIVSTESELKALQAQATKSEAALRNVGGTRKEIKEIREQLKDVNRLLKFDPKNTELLKQKHRLLKEEIKHTKDELENLKKSQKEIKAELKKGDIGKTEYEKFRREVIETEQSLKSLKKEARETNAVIRNFVKANTAISKATDKVKTKMAPVSAGIAGLGAAAVASVEGTEELRSDLSKLDQNAKEHRVNVDTARDAWKKFAVATDETDSAVEATANLLQAGFGESNLQKVMEGITGAYLRFPDTMKVESLADSLQETLATGESTGQFAELLDRLGISTESFNAKLQGAKTEAEKQNIVLQTLASAGLNDTYNAWVQNNDALVEGKQSTLDMQLQLAQLAEKIEPILTKITTIAVQVLEWFNNLSPSAQILIVAILGIIAAISPIAGIISAISAAAAASPVTWIVLAIVAAVAALVVVGVALYKNWDEIKEKAQELWEKVQTTFANMKAAADEAFAPIINWISGVIENAKKAVDELKNLFFWRKQSDDNDGGDGFGGAANGDTLTNGTRVVGELGAELLSVHNGRAVVTPLTTNKTATFNNTFNFTTPYSVNDGKSVVEQINRELGRIY